MSEPVRSFNNTGQGHENKPPEDWRSKVQLNCPQETLKKFQDIIANSSLFGKTTNNKYNV